MNKLLTYQGGQPFTLDDINFLDSAYREALLGLAQGLAPQNCIVTGCENSINANGNLVVEEGIVFIGGELFYHPTEVLANTPNVIYAFVPEIAQESVRTFKDGTTHAVWERRIVKVKIVESLTQENLSIDALYLKDLIRPGWNEWKPLEFIYSTPILGPVYRVSQDQSKIQLKGKLQVNLEGAGYEILAPVEEAFLASQELIYFTVVNLSYSVTLIGYLSGGFVRIKPYQEWASDTIAFNATVIL